MCESKNVKGAFLLVPGAHRERQREREVAVRKSYQPFIYPGIHASLISLAERWLEREKGGC